MVLKDLLELPTKIDEDILRGYSKLTKKWEDKGRSKYSLSGMFDIVSVPTIIFPALLSPTNIAIAPLLGYICGTSSAMSIDGIMNKEHSTGVKEENRKLIVNNKYHYFLDNLGKTIRAPELIAGASFMGKGIFDLYNSFANQDTSSLSEGLGNLMLGTSLASNASAWYIRDSNPKVLDKKPNWKKGLEKLIDYISPSQTEPSEIKIPVEY